MKPSIESLHQYYRSPGPFGQADVDAFETALIGDVEAISNHKGALKLEEGIRIHEFTNRLHSDTTSLVATAISCSDSLEVMGFADLIAMKNVYRKDYFAIFGTRIFVLDKFRGRGLSRSLISSVFSYVREFHATRQAKPGKPSLILTTILVPDTGPAAKARPSFVNAFKAEGAVQPLSDDPDFLVTVLPPA